MNGSHDQGFWAELRQDLVGFARSQGSPVPDAEDWAQTALLALVERGDTITHSRAYARAVIKNGLAALAKRQSRELTTDLEYLDSQAEQVGFDEYHRSDADTRAQELLVLLWRRYQQRKVAGLAYLGSTNKEIADLLGTKAPTAASNLRHAREALKPYRDIGEHTLRYGLAGRQLWEAFLCGETLPAVPRRMIIEAWKDAKALGVDPRHGAPVRIVEPDELTRRRERCRLDTARSWALTELAWLAMRAGMMMVVTDPDAVVLWRGGDPQVIRKVDKLGFGHGAYWGMTAQGVNGISLALATRGTAIVRKCEHSSKVIIASVALPSRCAIRGTAG